MGGYQLLGDLHITLPGHVNFRRAVSAGFGHWRTRWRTSLIRSGGVAPIIASILPAIPIKVLVERLTADKPGSYTGSH